MASGAPAPRALVSVFDKAGMVELGQGLAELGFEVVSTGGSAKALADAGVPVTPVEAITEFPEMLDGRVKTLHPKVHGGILARRDVPGHVEALETHDIAPIDVVIGNLYPFKATVASGGDFAECVEKIDIGGPSMLRGAAKNHAHVLVVTDPSDYSSVLEHLRGMREGSVTPEADSSFRRTLAWKAFQHCASYDAVVAEWLWREGAAGEGALAPPPEMAVPMTLQDTLRYGENPHQPAAFYLESSLGEMEGTGVAAATQHHGKEMSFNNYLDSDAAFSCVSDFTEPTCVIVKHTNPCGVASVSQGVDLLEAYRLAVRADPISAFGGIVAFNCPVTEELAKEIREFRSPTDGETRMFYEIVIAPEYTEDGLATLKGKSKTLRILEAKPRSAGGRSLRQVGGGFLMQGSDDLKPEDIEFTVVSQTQPTEEQMEDIRFAWRCVKHVKSNAITVAKGDRLLGMGSGQPNRVNSVRIALEKAGDEVEGSVLASDAFFPFSWGDSVELACQAGVKAIVHPGGSMRDQDAIDCCDKYGVALLTTGGIRHFRH